MSEIDVSECEFYQDNNGIEAQGCYERVDICELEDAKETGKSCCDVKDCYFKQLQKLKQENEELRNCINDYLIAITSDIVYDGEIKNTQTTPLEHLKELQKVKGKFEKVKELAQENKDTAQYQGICQSILQIIEGD